MSSSSLRLPGTRSSGGGLPLFALHHHTLDSSGLVDNPLEQAPHGRAFQRSAVYTRHVFDHLCLSLRRVNREPELSFYSTELDGALRTLVEQLHKLLVDSVYFVSPIFYRQIRIRPGSAQLARRFKSILETVRKHKRLKGQRIVSYPRPLSLCGANFKRQHFTAVHGRLQPTD